MHVVTMYFRRTSLRIRMIEVQFPVSSVKMEEHWIRHPAWRGRRVDGCNLSRWRLPCLRFMRAEGFNNAATFGNTGRPSSSPTIFVCETDHGPKNTTVGHTTSALCPRFNVQHRPGPRVMDKLFVIVIVMNKKLPQTTISMIKDNMTRYCCP